MTLPIGDSVRMARTLVYRADQEVDGRFELFAVALSEDLAGDFNNDGIVNAADYTVWRDTLANAAGGAEKYGIWKANFGRRRGDGQAAAVRQCQPVPEPAAWVLTITAIAAVDPMWPPTRKIRTLKLPFSRANPSPPAAPARILRSRS